METLVFESENKKSLNLLKDYATKLGISVKKNFAEIDKTKERERVKKLLKIADASVLPNDLTMDDILEEIRLSRLERDQKCS